VRRSWLLVVAWAVVGCSPAPDSQVVVSTAASLNLAFREIEMAFEAANPGIDVVLNVAGSSSLRDQILEGAPVDAYASADAFNMSAIAAAGLVDGDPEVLATNRMIIAVPPGNPGGVLGLADFAREDLLIGLCAEGVPCGDLARRVLSVAGVTAAVDTNESDARALVTKIEASELDAGLVYSSDVEAAEGSLEGIAIDDAHNVVTECSIGVLAGAPNPDGGAAFLEFVLSAHGRSILLDFGFATP
jgi:molybdate transport system substrate-binding protein